MNATAASASSGLPTLSLTMNGRSITASTATLPAGAVNVVSNVTGTTAAEPTLIELYPGVTYSQFVNDDQRAGAVLDYVSSDARILYDVVVNPGTISSQTMLYPGSWVALDTSGANPAKWPYTFFTVTANPATPQLPNAHATVKTTEFAIGAPRTLHNGEVVRFENDGYLIHAVYAARVNNARTAKEMTALLEQGRNKKAFALSRYYVTLAGPLTTNGVQQFAMGVKPGIYVLYCTWGIEDGRMQTQLGMVKTIRILR